LKYPKHHIFQNGGWRAKIETTPTLKGFVEKSISFLTSLLVILDVRVFVTALDSILIIADQ
jgi:hypothetical protein